MTFYQSEIFEFFNIFFRKSEFKVDLVMNEFYKIALGHRNTQSGQFSVNTGLLIEEIRVININFYDKETSWDTSLSFYRNYDKRIWEKIILF